MKKLILLGLMAFTLSLGVSCKKDNEIVEEEVKIELKKSDNTVPIFDYNPNVYPHNTGICLCKQGPKCWGNHYPLCPAKEFGSGKPCFCFMDPRLN